MPEATPLDVVRANNLAFSRRDVEGMLALYAPDAVVIDRRKMGLLGTFRGRDELRDYYLGIFHAAASMQEDLEVLAERDGMVVTDCVLRGRLAADPDGREMVAPYGLILHIDGGLIQRLEIYDDGRDALAESGLA